MMNPDKIDAIYQLRDAAEESGRLEAELRSRMDHEARDQRLAARTKLEETTMKAIHACEYCGRAHAEEEPHAF